MKYLFGFVQLRSSWIPICSHYCDWCYLSSIWGYYAKAAVNMLDKIYVISVQELSLALKPVDIWFRVWISSSQVVLVLERSTADHRDPPQLRTSRHGATSPRPDLTCQGGLSSAVQTRRNLHCGRPESASTQLGCPETEESALWPNPETTSPTCTPTDL